MIYVQSFSFLYIKSILTEFCLVYSLVHHMKKSNLPKKISNSAKNNSLITGLRQQNYLSRFP